jgi:hypothetical protein
VGLLIEVFIKIEIEVFSAYSLIPLVVLVGVVVVLVVTV